MDGNSEGDSTDRHGPHGSNGPPEGRNDGIGQRRGRRGHDRADRDSHGLPGGLSIAADGLRLVPSDVSFEPGVERDWTYRIRDGAGNVVTDFEETHGESSHLVLVRRDLTRFRHLHPEMADDGTWRARLTLPDPGVYRAFVDVRVGGRSTTLGVDLFAPGAAEFEPRPGSTSEAAVEGYVVSLRPAGISAGDAVSLAFELRSEAGDGPAPRLEPYLGAHGHLVALREGDLAYLHVHPEETDPESGIVRFETAFPTAGRYRLFLQVKPEGRLITVPFDVRIGERAPERASEPA
ncbi:hypothetical protein [Halegenticoccus soli]|uniref:hypothetical protein n=1 Tax=Halegenticoccus soli TaxID=1985678 RepID=UPI000C6C934E|nr:hypothetical protein [Halegenticoccus soli]